MDATLIESHKRQALHSDKGYQAYQPLNCWWAEQEVMVRQIVRLSAAADTLAWVLSAQRRIRALARASPG